MLSFPNESRNYETGGDRIKFWGNDGIVDVPFFLETNILFRLYPRTGNTEAAILAAFDAGRTRIQQMASKAYSRTRRTFYILGADSL